MVGTFKANNPVNTFLLFVYGLLLKLAYFSTMPVTLIKSTDGILYKDLLLALQTISKDLPIVFSFVTYLLLFTQAVSFNKIINNQRLFQRNTYLPAMSYLLITSLFPEWNVLSSALIVNTLLIWIWIKINGLQNSLNPKATLFNTGLVTGICAFFYFPSIVFSLLILFALLLSRPFNFTEWIIALIGALAPYYYFFIWLLLSGNFNFHPFPVFHTGYPSFHHKYTQWLALALIATALAAGAWFVQTNFRNQVVQTRKSWSILLFYVLMAIWIPFINNNNSLQNWIIAALPLSVFISGAFLYPSKKWFPLLLHWLIVGFVIFTCYYNK